MDTRYAQTERRQGQTDEDLGTAEGRAKRTSELKALRDEKAAQLQRVRKRVSGLQTEVKLLENMLRKLAGLLKGKKRARGAKAVKIRERMRGYDDRLVERKAELRSLGFQVADLELDMGDSGQQHRGGQRHAGHGCGSVSRRLRRSLRLRPRSRGWRSCRTGCR
jgi:chromosome segregation ATPase